MLHLLRALAIAPVKREEPLSDDAVLHAVNLGAMVHNLLAAYEQALASSDFTRFHRKLYELSVDFNEADAADAREEMRQEWLRRSRESRQS